MVDLIVSFLMVLQDSNSLLEMSDDAILQKGLLILSYPERLKTLNTKCEENYLEIDLTMSFNYNFRLSLKLNQGSKELVRIKTDHYFLLCV